MKTTFFSLLLSLSFGSFGQVQTSDLKESKILSVQIIDDNPNGLVHAELVKNIERIQLNVEADIVSLQLNRVNNAFSTSSSTINTHNLLSYEKELQQEITATKIKPNSIV